MGVGLLFDEGVHFGWAVDLDVRDSVGGRGAVKIDGARDVIFVFVVSGHDQGTVRDGSVDETRQENLSG